VDLHVADDAVAGGVPPLAQPDADIAGAGLAPADRLRLGGGLRRIRPRRGAFAQLALDRLRGAQARRHADAGVLHAELVVADVDRGGAPGIGEADILRDEAVDDELRIAGRRELGVDAVAAGVADVDIADGHVVGGDVALAGILDADAVAGRGEDG